MEKKTEKVKVTGDLKIKENSELPLAEWVISRKKNGLEFKRIKNMF